MTLAQATQEIAEDLPAGIGTKGAFLLNILDCTGQSETPIGYLWYKGTSDKQTIFLCDFYIFPTQQGKGLGKSALRAFENERAAEGIQHLKLRVAADNARAHHVYKASGFLETGINMRKEITSK